MGERHGCSKEEVESVKDSQSGQVAIRRRFHPSLRKYDNVDGISCHSEQNHDRNDDFLDHEASIFQDFFDFGRARHER